MERAKSFFDDVKKEIECPVCQEQFGANKQPKILKCLHTFCKSCLEGWLRQHRTGALSCPTCRTVTECPNNDIDSLPSNLFYKQMVEIVEAYTGQEESSCCGNCDEQKSLRFYCSDCNCLLCEECARVHKKWKDFRGHQLKEIGQLQSSDLEDYFRRANVCKEHDDEFRFFCDACQICICRDCAILGHDCHKKISLEKGLKNKTTEIENKIREVQANGSHVRNKKESLEKGRIRVMNSFERATNSVRTVAEQWITFIRKHEADITGKLIKQKDAFEAEFLNQMSSLDGRVVEIESSLDFGAEILSRRNLPEILNVEEMLKNRLQELSVPFEPTLVFPEVVYSSNNFSCLKDGPGKLIRTVTEPMVSVAEGRGLNEAIQGEESTFTVITKDIKGQIVYSEIDQVNVEIISISTMGILTASVTDSKNGRYQIKYRSETADDFKISVTVRGEAIKDSPFRLQVKKRETQPFRQFHKYRFTSMKPGMKAESKKSKMTGGIAHLYLIDRTAQEAGAWCRDGTDEDDENFKSDDQLEHMLGSVELSVVKGDITDQNADMMVNAADCKLSHDAGVAGTIIDKGGFGIQKEFIEFFQIQKDRSLAASTTAPKPPSSKREKNKGKNETDDVNDPLISDSDSSSKSFCDAVTSNRREDALNGKGLRVGPSEDSASRGASKDDECVICWDAIENPEKLGCRHVFRTDSVETTLTYDNRSPLCKERQGVKGNQPDGKMHVNHSQQSLPGYHGCGTIIIVYSFPSGIQGREHPHPGETYSSTSRTAYLPDNREGKEVLALLRRAFDARLVFTVGGTSITSELRNQITWNGIHHKTNISGGPHEYGYPDSGYLRRVKRDLAAKGIR
ncbi:E3 ubiquitin-protein ligase TRIM45 [Pocillopora verrucosa]|uniref:E3 ubiquitin-protein ligase TRIM45 n=1 Tax=Pocillopora verrucosa TaxID=203993 RepID=UPI00333FD78D